MKIEECTTIREFAATLTELPETIERDNFTAIAKKAIELGFTEAELADTFGVSRSAIGRWSTGVTAPHPFARSSVIKTLIELASSR